MTACLGGWCRIRNACPNYHAIDRRDPVERLCPKGHDGAPRVRVVHVYPRTPTPRLAAV